MTRREYLRASLAASVVAGQRFSWAGSPGASAVLLEAAQFQDLGGWGLDSQYMDQMGSGFLIAHGIGKPVADAVAKVRLPETGAYRLWVRTRDWVAPWKTADTPGTKRAKGTPGVFKVTVDGVPVETTFGDRNAEWHWQDGGTIEVAKPDIEIALRDLTGFAGRCAAVFLTRDLRLVPPHGARDLTRFRRKWHGVSDTPEDAGTYDLVVVGGGVAGMCAALVAARRGVTVALIQDRPVLGGNNSSEVRMHLSGRGRSAYSDTLGDVLAEIDIPNNERKEAFPGTRPMHASKGFLDDRKAALVRAEDNIALFPKFRMNHVEMKGGRVAAVVAESIASSRRLRVTARYFADCTGDACVGYLAGADYEISANEHMGRSNQWSVQDVGEPTSFPRCPWALDLADKPFPGRDLKPGTKAPKYVNAFGNWYWESGFNHDPIAKGEYIRDWNLRAMYGAWDAVKNVLKTYPTHDLVWAAFISGMRESRRLLGDIILNEEDVTKPNWYDDGIVPTGWKIDVHYPHPSYNRGFEGDAFISTVKFKKCVNPYYIPYRCLYSRNVPNLFMAGRDISVTRAGLGTVRVMRTTALMGEVVGMAAVLCVEHQVDPRAVYKEHLKELRVLCGMAPDVVPTTATADSATAANVPQGITVLEPGNARRATEQTTKYRISALSRELKAYRSVVVPRGVWRAPGRGFSFKLSAPAVVFIAVHQRGNYTPPDGWTETDMRLSWSSGITDTLYMRSCDAGVIEIPEHTGKEGSNYGLPHMVFVKGADVVISPAE